MSVIVLDASAIVSLLVPSQATAAAARLFSESGLRFLCPSIARVEVSHVVIKLERRGLLPIGHLDPRLQDLETTISFVFWQDADILHRARELARALTLGAYDALYLDLARTEGAVLASRDAALLRGAGAAGVGVCDLR